MKGILILEGDQWVMFKPDEDLSIPLVQEDCDYLTFFDAEYIQESMLRKELDFDVVNEFDNPECFSNTPWGGGAIQAKINFSKERDKGAGSWEYIMRRHKHMTDGEFIDCLVNNYLPPSMINPI